MEFDLAPEQEALRAYVAEFVRRYAPREKAREIEEKGEFPHDLWARMAEAGLHGCAIEPEYGGTGGDIVSQAIVAEELAHGLAGIAWIWAASSCFGGKSVGLFGSEAQKSRYLPLLAEGKIKFALSITEPGGGTDVLGAMRTTAEPSGDGFRLNGAKMFTSGAQVADYLLVVARTRKLSEVARRGQGVSLLIVDARSPGVGIRPLRMLGLRAIGTCEVIFADVWVPREQLLGPQDDGWYRLVGTLDNERILTAAICVGVTRAVLEDAVTYARTREAFGGPIGRFQALQHYLAEIAMRLEQARLLTYHAAWLQARGRPCAREAVMAKVSASETASWAADTGIQILGGYGCAMEFDMQRYWRDVRASRVSPISNEMGRNFIAESLGLPRSY